MIPDDYEEPIKPTTRESAVRRSLRAKGPAPHQWRGRRHRYLVSRVAIVKFPSCVQHISHPIRVAQEVHKNPLQESRESSLFRTRRQQDDLPNAAFLP